MAILVPDSTRKVPLQEIPFTEYSISDLMETMINLKRSLVPTWTDESPSDLGMMLLSLFTSLTNLAMLSTNQAAANCSLATATEREQVRALCKQLGYTLREGAPATVLVYFGFESGHPQFTLPAGTKVATSGSDGDDVIVFETMVDHVINVGISASFLACIQGETATNEIIGSSDGTVNQAKYLGKRPVVWQSETISVYEGVSWEDWTRVDDFLSSGPTSKHYTIDLDNFGYCYIFFGDGTNGKIPAQGSNNIRATYRRGGGSAGNVGANQITDLLSNVQYVSQVANGLAASGGEDQESIAHAKKMAPFIAHTMQTAINAKAIRALAEGYISPDYGGIAKAKAVAIDNLTVDVRIIPANGGLPSAGLKADLVDYLNSEAIAPILWEFAVNDPDYLAVSYIVNIYVLDGYQRTSVVEQVRQAIVKFGSPNYRDPQGFYPNEFGETISVGKLYQAVQNVPGVERAMIVYPSSDMIMPDYQIRSVNSIDIIAYQGGVSSSYLALSTTL